MRGNERDTMRRELDEALLPFRLVRKRKVGGRETGGVGWLKSIRQAVGVPVDEVARRLGVCRWEIHRLEESEKNARIMLATLGRAAEGLGCELVYALIPKQGTLEDLAGEQRAVCKRALEKKRAERTARIKPWLETIGWREKFQNRLRTLLRRDGVRVRPRKTNRRDAERKAEFEMALKLAGGRTGNREQEKGGLMRACFKRRRKDSVPGEVCGLAGAG